MVRKVLVPEERRIDDLVRPDGEPISAAHQAIYAHIGECAIEIRAGQEKMHREMEERLSKVHSDHLLEHHHPSIKAIAESMGRTPSELMIEFVEVLPLIPRVVEALDGPEITLLDGTLDRRHEEGLLWQTKDIQKQMRNGIKHKAEMSKAQIAFAGTALTALVTIAAALIGKI